MERFAEKLRDLMCLENVTNARLARALRVDASLISRWRGGTRVPGDNAGYIERLADFFASCATEEYQRQEILKLTGAAPPLNMGRGDLAGIIGDWFRQAPEMEKRRSLSNLFRNISEMPQSRVGSEGMFVHLQTGAVQNGQCFFGAGGKRQAVLLLLALAAEQPGPCDMILFSDETLDWLNKGKYFYEQLLALFQKVVNKGGTLKFIHPSTRRRGRVTSSVEDWLPFYLTGAVEVYNCGRYRDNLFQRFLFAVPGVGAIDSGGLVEGGATATFLFTDQAAVDGLRRQLEGVLELCQSSMNICRTANALTTTEVMSDYWSKEGEILFKGNVLQLNTLPEHMLDELLERAALPEEQRRAVERAIRIRAENFFRSIEKNVCIAMVPLHSPEEVAAGKVYFSNAELLLGINLPYTVEQYARHLASIIDIMRANKNYHFQVVEEVWNNVIIMSKLGAGTVLSKLQGPVFTFFSDYEDYPQFTETVCECLEEEYERLPPLWRTHTYNLRRLMGQLEVFEHWLEEHGGHSI